MGIEVRILAGNETASLDEESLAVVAATDIVIVIGGASDLPIRLDGRIRSFRETGAGRLLALDLTRSTGFHHLHIPPGHHFFFGTEDAKTGLEGIRRMLSFLKNECRTWAGQLLFSDGSYLRDATVVYGWLDQHADAALASAERIAAAPRKGRTTQSFITPRGGRHVHVAQTLRLLRARGAEYLEETPGGVIAVGLKTFMPRKVVATRSAVTLDNVANRRVIRLASTLLGLTTEVATEADDQKVKGRCRDWAERAQRILLLSALAPLAHRSTGGGLPPQPSPEEQLVPDYMQTYQVAMLLNERFEWAAKLTRQPQHAFVNYSDEIYQTFVAYAIAEALGMDATGHVLGMTQPAFVTPEWSVFFNVMPPPNLMRSWRSYTSEPDDYRPDLLFSHHENEVVLSDAKFRSAGEKASESSRKDLLSYMAAYDAPTAVIFYPPVPNDRLQVKSIEWGGRKLIEVAIAPTSGLIGFLQKELPSVLKTARFAARWRD